MATENGTEPRGASRHVVVSYRGIALADDHALLEAAAEQAGAGVRPTGDAGKRWFLHSAAPMPVGTTVELAASTSAEARVSARVVEVVEPRRKARGSESTTPGMLVELDEDALALLEPSSVFAADAPAAAAAPEELAAAEPAAADTPEELAAAELAAAEPAAAEPAAEDTPEELAAAEPAAEEAPVYEVEAAPPAHGEPELSDPIVLESTSESADDFDDESASDADAASADDDADGKKKKRRRKRKKRPTRTG